VEGLMYFASVVLLLFVLPVGFVAGETVLSHHASSVLLLTGKWFVFWGIGVRLLMAGVRQTLQPRFTAEEIFHVHDAGSFAIVREVGFANLAMGTLGVWSLFHQGWIVPAAIVGGLYYGLAGVGHVLKKERNAKETMAMLSDAFIFVVLLVFVVKTLS
jgi:hypothetical protein